MACILAACGPSLSLRTFVRDRTYPDGQSHAGRTDYPLVTYAILRPVLDRPYTDCVHAAVSIRNCSANRLVELGFRLRNAPDAQSWANIVQDGVPAAGSDVDPLERLAIGEAAGDLAGYLETTEPNEGDRRLMLVAADGALRRIAQQLEDTGETCGRDRTDDGAAPSTTLALSGGSANGAFTAGFLFELFYLRERIALALGEHPRETFLQSSRFTTTTGTSVGALLAQVVDLYYTNDLGDSDRLTREALAAFRSDELACQRYPVRAPPAHRRLPDMSDEFVRREVRVGRIAQVYALGLIQEYFTDAAEPEVVCVQRGSLTRLVGLLGRRQSGLMRFDPLQHNVIDGVLDASGPAMLANAMRRIVVSVEVLQNLAVGLDERACLNMPGNELSECLAAGVVASSMLPVFAQPVNRVHTGARDGPDCGIWLDAGIRNGLPAYHALMRSRPACVGSEPTRLRTLAISTDRVGGVPTAPHRDADAVLSIALEAIGEMGNQLHNVEAAFVGLAASVQQQRYSELAYPRAAIDDARGRCESARAALDDCVAALRGDSTQAQVREACRSRVGAFRASCALQLPRAYGETARVCRSSLPLDQLEQCEESITAADLRCAPVVAVPPAPFSATDVTACLSALTTASGICAMPSGAGPSAVSNAWLELVFVPTAVPLHIAAPTGYAFDPYVMRGLFVHGRDVAIRRLLPSDPTSTAEERAHRDLAARIGWNLSGEAGGALRDLLVRDQEEIRPWIDFYRREIDRAERRAEGRRRFDSGQVEYCEEAPLYRDVPAPENPDHSRRIPGYFGGQGQGCQCNFGGQGQACE